MRFHGKHILLGVTGGIAAYKAAELVRAFQKEEADVRVIMTPSASRFVGTETFKALSRNDVAIDIFSDNPNEEWSRHIQWAKWANLFVIAPCTANTLGKIASGMSDNMLTATVLASRSPILLCPTMDGEMYHSPAVKQNLQKIESYGYHILEPDSGYLASGLDGTGRLPEYETILQKAHSLIELDKKEPFLAEKCVLVTAGATKEHLDPVRFISNPSTGKMGIAMAQAAKKAGANVTLIYGEIKTDLPQGIFSKKITTAQELFEEVTSHSEEFDIIIMAAAVSDYAPIKTSASKIKKNENDNLTISLKPTPDILHWLGEHKQKNQTLIGFAMETDNLLENARKKLKKKQVDFIIANELVEGKSGFALDSNYVHVVSPDRETSFSGLKTDISTLILSYIFNSDLK